MIRETGLGTAGEQGGSAGATLPRPYLPTSRLRCVRLPQAISVQCSHDDRKLAVPYLTLFSRRPPQGDPFSKSFNGLRDIIEQARRWSRTPRLSCAVFGRRAFTAWPSTRSRVRFLPQLSAECAQRSPDHNERNGQCRRETTFRGDYCSRTDQRK